MHILSRRTCADMIWYSLRTLRLRLNCFRSSRFHCPRLRSVNCIAVTRSLRHCFKAVRRGFRLARLAPLARSTPLPPPHCLTAVSLNFVRSTPPHFVRRDSVSLSLDSITPAHTPPRLSFNVCLAVNSSAAFFISEGGNMTPHPPPRPPPKPLKNLLKNFALIRLFTGQMLFLYVTIFLCITKREGSQYYDYSLPSENP